MMEAYTAFAPCYDAMMGDVDYDAWAKYLHELLQKAGAKTVLECACGTGNLTLRLGKLGYSVIGTDISEDMLMVARQKALDAGLRLLPFACQSMEKVRIHRPVDALVCACDGVNYLQNGPEAFFACANRALKRGGVLLFDVSSAYKLQHVLGDNTFAATGKDWAYIWENAWRPQLRRVDMVLTGFVAQGSAYRRFEEQHIQRAYAVGELTDALAAAGFRDIEVMEAFTRQAPGPQTERIQFFARKG